MKAYFIFKDGELVGSPIGYKTEDEAQIDIDKSDEYKELYKKYKILDSGFIGDNNPFFEKCLGTGCYRFNPKLGWYQFDKEIWKNKIWIPYVNEHFKIIEKEFEIIFK